MTVENYSNHQVSHIKDKDKGNYSIQAQSSTHKKCPIYIHNFTKVHHNDGDFVPKNGKKIQNKKKSVMDKLEETYWANWKPDKTELKKSMSPLLPMKIPKTPEIQVIKSAPERRKKIKVYPPSDDSVPKDQAEKKEKNKKISSKSQEIQTEDLPTLPEIVEKPEETKNESALEIVDVSASEEAPVDKKFLKHTDSFIINVKKHQAEKEHFEQPKCIRLYRKPGKILSKNFVKGGSYPLKSCLKKESNFSKRSSKHNRPGSPIIVSSSFGTKNRFGKFHR